MTHAAMTPFVFEGENVVRVIARDDVPWFVLADVCRVLGIGNPSQAATRLDDDERATLTNNEGAKINGLASILLI